MQITPPFGYREAVPSFKTQKVKLLESGAIAEFVRRGNAIPISHTEFQLAGRDYPIVFASSLICIEKSLVDAAGGEAMLDALRQAERALDERKSGRVASVAKTATSG